MKLKLDAAGNVVTKEVNGVKMPVYVHDDGKEVEFDAASTVATIARINGEAKAHREAKEAAEKVLKVYTDAGVTDHAAAVAGLAKLKTIDLTKLVDAGKVEEVKAQVSAVFQAELDKLKAENGTLSKQNYDLLIGGSFSRSKLIGDKPGQLSIPADMAQAAFGSHFTVEGNKIVAKYKDGNPVYSKVKAGELADFDEALGLLVEAYPNKNSILRGSGGNGSGGGGSKGAGGSATLDRKAFDAMGPVEQRAALAAGTKLIDTAPAG
jgi:hypothetical protein